MKHLFLFFFLAFATTLFAQECDKLVVQDVKGTAMLQDGKSRTVIAPGQTIKERDIVKLSSNVTLILLNPQLNMRYTLKGAYTGSIHNYLQRNRQSCAKTVTRKYMDYLLSQALRPKAKASRQQEDGHATVFREGDSMLDVEDSITLTARSLDSLYSTIDSLIVVLPDSTALPSPQQ